jgi:hypothetical protein
MRFDSRTRKIVKQEEYPSNWQNPWSKWHQHFSTLLEKLTTWGQYSGSWVGEQTIFRSAGGNERWSNDESMHWGQWCLKKANQQDKHSDHYWGQCCSKTVSDLVNFSSNWWATLHLKDIFISSSWFIISNMAITFEWCYRIVAFEWMLERCTHQDWLWDHLRWSSNAHFTAWIWVMNIIDDAKSFLFISWFDKLRGI